MVNGRSQPKYAEYLIFGLSLALTAGLFVYFTGRLDFEDARLAYDWRIFWHSMEGGHMRWDLKMFNPPWVVFFLRPLGLLPPQTGWGLMTFFSFVVLVFSVPRYAGARRQIAGIFLLVLSYSAARNFMDANLEAITIAAILVLIGYERRSALPFVVAALMCTVKPQIVYLLVIVIAVYLFQTRERSFFLRVSAVIAVIVVLSILWAGQPWLDALGEQRFDYGMSLRETGERFGVPRLWLFSAQAAIMLVTLAVAFLGNRTLSRAKVGMLLAGSLIAAPFSNAHSVLVVLALGVIPLMLEQPVIGLPLYVLFQVPYLDLVHRFPGRIINYWTVVLTVSWVVLTAIVYWRECRQPAPAVMDPIWRQQTS